MNSSTPTSPVSTSSVSPSQSSSHTVVNLNERDLRDVEVRTDSSSQKPLQEIAGDVARESDRDLTSSTTLIDLKTAEAPTSEVHELAVDQLLDLDLVDEDRTPPSSSGTSTPEEGEVEAHQGGVDLEAVTDQLKEVGEEGDADNSAAVDGSVPPKEENHTENLDGQEKKPLNDEQDSNAKVAGVNANAGENANDGAGIIQPGVAEVIKPEVAEVIQPEVVVQEENNGPPAPPAVVPAAAAAAVPAAAPAAIQVAAVAAIQDAANNDTTHFIQEIIKNGIVGLQGLVAGSQAEVSSHLETNPDGSGKLETHEMHGSNEVFYKINATYTLTLKDVNGHKIRNAQNQPIQVTIKRYIAIKTPVEPREALKRASFYKDAMVQLAKNNAANDTAGRLSGTDYTDANRAALLGQRDFTFLPNGELSAVIPAAAAGQRDRTVTLNLAPKYAADSNHRYVRNFTGANTGKAKHKEIDPESERLASGKKIYQSKAEALKDAQYTIVDNDNLFYKKLITHPKFDYKLFELQDDVKKKEQELKVLEEQFKESRLLGFGSKNKPEFEEFLTETASKYQDDFEARRSKEKTRYLTLEKEKAKLDAWKSTRKPILKAGVSELESFLNVTQDGTRNATTELRGLDPRIQQHVGRQQLDIKEKLAGLKAVKNDLTAAQQTKITTLMALNDVTAINTELNNNTDPVNNEIRLALSAQEIRIKTHVAIKEWQDELTEKAGTKQQLQQAEVQSQAKLDVFNQNLIRLENAQKELKSLTSRLSDLRTKADNEIKTPVDADRTENCKKIMGAITEKRIAELDKQSKKSEDLIVDLRKQLISAGVKEAPGAVVVGEA